VDKKKSQSFNFAFEALPIMFHSQTKDFNKFIERDGLQFLEFWWNHVGGQLPEDKLVPFSGMAFETHQPEEKLRMTVVTLPYPREDGEIYYLALVNRPDKRFGWVRLPTTRVIALVRRAKVEEDDSGTELGDITPRGIFVSLGEGPEPRKEVFIKHVLGLVIKKTE
jgi:hypothetical protein